MDTIHIRDLELFAYHGVQPLEKEYGQTFLLDLRLGLCLRKAGQSDDLADTVNYAAVIESVTREFIRQKDNLLERAAQRICDALLRDYPQIHSIRLRLKKPDAPIPARFAYVAVELLREREGEADA